MARMVQKVSEYRLFSLDQMITYPRNRNFIRKCLEYWL